MSVSVIIIIIHTRLLRSKYGPSFKIMVKVTEEQKTALVDFIEMRPHLNGAKLSCQLSHNDILQQWEEITTILNVMPFGAVKDAHKWKKCWQDIKSNAKIRLGEYRRSVAATGGGPATKNLEEMDLKIGAIIGTTAIEGIAGISETQFSRNMTQTRVTLPATQTAPTQIHTPSPAILTSGTGNATPSRPVPSQRQIHNTKGHFSTATETLASLGERKLALKEKELEERRYYHKQKLRALKKKRHEKRAYQNTKIKTLLVLTQEIKEISHLIQGHIFPTEYPTEYLIDESVPMK